MTNLPSYYRQNITWIDQMDRRLTVMADLVAEGHPVSVADLGCGQGVLLDALVERLSPEAHLVGVDAAPPLDGVRWTAVTTDIASELPFSDHCFDAVIAGEVIEHVPHPDLLLREIRRILTPTGRLVLSTPNIVSWANRILVPLGIQPLFTETSSEVHLGRRWRALGQGNQAQGHLKVFSRRALAEILERCGFTVKSMIGMPAEFPSPVDRIDRYCARFPSIASDLVVVATPAMRIPDVEAPRRKRGSVSTSKATSGSEERLCRTRRPIHEPS